MNQIKNIVVFHISDVYEEGFVSIERINSRILKCMKIIPIGLIQKEVILR